MLTPLARAKGMGSAHTGAHHWWAQRLTALLLVPLGLWLVYGLLTHMGASAADARAWLAKPLVSLAMGATCLALFHHVQLGMQVVIEDYIHIRWLEVALVLIVRLAAMLGAGICLLAIIRIQMGA